MPHPSLAAAWEHDRAAIGGWVSGGSEFALDLYGRARYDYIGIDCPPTARHEARAAAMLRRVPDSSPAIIVRVSRNDPDLIGRLGEAGADGIIVPMVDTAADAAAAVAAARRDPLRGEAVSVFAMIETAAGMDHLDDIAATEGLTGVYVGPADLSIGLGLDPLSAFTTDQLVAPVERIRRACAANGIILGMHQLNAATATTWIARGVRLASLGSDGGLFLTAAVAALRGDRAGASVPTGPNPPEV
jgi:4-hydroxy-2-oxoheptanedioate aldolase